MDAKDGYSMGRRGGWRAVQSAAHHPSTRSSLSGRSNYSARHVRGWVSEGGRRLEAGGKGGTGVEMAVYVRKPCAGLDEVSGGRRVVWRHRSPGGRNEAKRREWLDDGWRGVGRHKHTKRA